MTTEYTLYSPPKPVGWWVVPGGSLEGCVKFACFKKPNWLVRFSMRYVFGWKYESYL
jgi:hypothetical protein